MNKLSTERKTAVVQALVEGNSVRATGRMTGTAKGTILRLLAEVGEACLTYQRETLVKLPCKRVQVDEIWAFVGSKEKNTDPALRGLGRVGDVWTWVALCADTKLVPAWHVGARDANAAELFLTDLAGRLANRVQLTADGHGAYLSAVGPAFEWDVDFAQLVKIYGAPMEGQRRYSPAQLLRIEKNDVIGNPDAKHISTSYVERANLTMRMQMRRFTRLTNGFSKKLENHAHAVSVHYMHYNFCRSHQTLTRDKKGVHTTPAMAAGVASHKWTVRELVELVDRYAQ